MSKAFLIFQNAQVVNKIVPFDADAELIALKEVYADPSFTVMSLDSEDPIFINSNADVLAPRVAMVELVDEKPIEAPLIPGPEAAGETAHD